MEIFVIIEVLKRKWWVIPSAIFIAVGSGYFITKNLTPIYAARVAYVITPSQQLLEEGSFVGSLSVLSGQTSITNTYVNVATSAAIRSDAVAALGITPKQNRQLALYSRMRSGTNVIEITVEGSDPLLVQAFANHVGFRTQEYVNRLYEVYQIQVIDSAQFPVKPVWPNMYFHLVLAFASGIVIGFGTILIASVRNL